MATDEGNATVTKPYREPVTDQDFRDAILGYTAEAQGILDAVEDAQRDLSDAQRKHIDEALLKAEGLKVRWDQKKKRAGRAAGAAEALSGSSFSTSFGDITQVFGSGGDTYTPQGKAVRGQKWAAAVLRECSDGSGLRSHKGLTPSGAVLVQVEAPEPVAMGRPVAMLRSLIPAEPTSGNYAFLRQTIRESNADVVAPGALKPTSRYEFEEVRDHARVIAHLSEPITRQSLADAKLLQEFVATEMAFGTEQELEDQVLNGSGIGENLLGLKNTPGILTVPAPTVPDDAYWLIRTLRKGITALEVQGLEASGIILHPSDFEAIESAATDEGAFTLNGAGSTVPIDRAARRLWGVPVVSTPACVPGTAWVADFVGSTKLYIRSETVLSWSENTWRPDGLGVGVGASDFSRNLVAFRSEMRAGFATTRPSGVVRVSLA